VANGLNKAARGAACVPIVEAPTRAIVPAARAPDPPDAEGCEGFTPLAEAPVPAPAPAVAPPAAGPVKPADMDAKTWDLVRIQALKSFSNRGAP
jgi:hypothetical protein